MCLISTKSIILLVSNFTFKFLFSFSYVLIKYIGHGFTPLKLFYDWISNELSFLCFHLTNTCKWVFILKNIMFLLSSYFYLLTVRNSKKTQVLIPFLISGYDFWTWESSAKKNKNHGNKQNIRKTKFDFKRNIRTWNKYHGVIWLI